MATTTTNFGWDIPQSTDLLKDGATAIAALGQDIDTALVDLKGGTTGQVLAKASGTNLDYSWTTPSAGSIVLVKAVTFSAASTVDLSNSFSSAYDHYLINGSITSSADGDLLYRWRVSGSDDSSANYHYQLADISGATGTNVRLTGQTSGRLCATRASSARESFKTELYNPFLTATKNYVGHAAIFSDSSIYINQISGSFNSATSFTGMTVYPSSGTITGSLFIYGYKNS
jgi:hypothetical protein